MLILYPEKPRPRVAGKEEQKFHDVGQKGEKEEDTWQLRGTSRVFLSLLLLRSQLALRWVLPLYPKYP